MPLMWRGWQKLTVPVETVAVTFKDDATFYLPFRSYRREAIR